MDRAADTPALLVDLDRMERNIAEMAALARAAGVALRPHFKTHKSVAIARRQIAAGAVGMTVAKLDEAEALIDAGVDDILARLRDRRPRRSCARAIDLARRARLTLGVDGVDGRAAIVRRGGCGGPAGAGSRSRSECGLASLRRRARRPPRPSRWHRRPPGLVLDGVFTHAGQCVRGDRIARTGRADRRRGGGRRARCGARRSARSGSTCRIVSVGLHADRRAASPREPGLTEIRPGNYVFYDAMQVALGTVADGRDRAERSRATVISRPDAGPGRDRCRLQDLRPRQGRARR